MGSYFYIILLFIFVPSLSQAEDKCQISYAKKSDLVGHSYETKAISTLSSEINQALKKSFEFAEMVDRHSFGLVSLAIAMLFDSELDQTRKTDPTADPITSGTRPPNMGAQDLFVVLSDLKPEKWNQLTIRGSLVFKTNTNNLVPLKGVNLTFSDGKTAHKVTTDRNGEFVEHLYNLIPSERLSYYKGVQIKRLSANQASMTLPIEIKIEAKQCTQTLKLSEVPFEPLVFFIIQSDGES